MIDLLPFAYVFQSAVGRTHSWSNSTKSLTIGGSTWGTRVRFPTDAGTFIERTMGT